MYLQLMEILIELEKITQQLKNAIDDLVIEPEPQRGLSINEISFVGDSSGSD